MDKKAKKDDRSDRFIGRPSEVLFTPRTDGKRAKLYTEEEAKKVFGDI